MPSLERRRLPEDAGAASQRPKFLQEGWRGAPGAPWGGGGVPALAGLALGGFEPLSSTLDSVIPVLPPWPSPQDTGLIPELHKRDHSLLRWRFPQGRAGDCTDAAHPVRVRVGTG